jgi:multidrug efflux pump subunit AcrB
MTLAEYAIKNSVISWTITLLLIVGGILSFLGLGRLEDPEFTIKQAVVVTAYPGASAQEVEEEVTLPVENAIQQLPYVDHITSISSTGLSQVTVEMKSKYRKKELAQIWDEMRRKIRDMQSTLPSGTAAPQIIDDFGDVYGMFLTVTGGSYQYDELADYVDYLRRELVLINGVGKVNVGGRRIKQIILEINRTKLTALGLSINALRSLLQSQNLVSNAGRIRVGSEYIRINATSSEKTGEQLGSLMLGRANGKIIYLSDVVTLSQDYQTPPTHLYRFNGSSALSIGISFASGVNVVEVGERVRARLRELEGKRPIGMMVGMVYDQPAQVDASIRSFVVSLGQAVLIVIIVLLIAMGLRSGLLMSVVLLLTILATFIVMLVAGMDLHRISLGALIIALGMLVDNAIVITEGILIGLRQGLSKLEAAKRIVSHTKYPLLGATVISITAFAPIGLSPDASGEFTGTLFWVLMISLSISWLLAISLTPFFANLMFKEHVGKEDESDDPYDGFIFKIYRVILLWALRFRWLTVLLVLVTLGGTLYGLRFVDKTFFPPSSTPMFLVDYWLPEGSDIRATEENMARLEKEIRKIPEVRQVTTSIGRGALRFMLTYQAERSYASYGQFLVQTRDYEGVAKARKAVDRLILEQEPQAFSKSQRINIGPANKAKIEARISGPDPAILRDLAAKMMARFRQDPDAFNIRHDWRERTKILRPRFAEAEARRLGISKSDLNQAIAMNLTGVQVGIYRDGSTKLPIILRLPKHERSNVSQLGEVRVFSSSSQSYVGIDQVIKGIDLGFENPLIMRRDRKRTIQVWVDPNPNGNSNSFALFERLRPIAESITLPIDYTLSWGGEHESQEKANKAVFAFVPIGIVVMVMITIFLFNSVRKMAVIWLTVPLSFIGVTSGLIIMQQPFSFMALLGVLSLSGMVIKNGIVLVEEIVRLEDEDEEKKSMHDAITLAAISRLRPVAMAAITTILGLIPLLSDVFFAPLAVTIMFGLGFATILTLVVVPVLFALFYGIHFKRNEHIA